jgi:hypothetical protein
MNEWCEKAGLAIINNTKQVERPSAIALIKAPPVRSLLEHFSYRGQITDTRAGPQTRFAKLSRLCQRRTLLCDVWRIPENHAAIGV